MVFYAPDLIQIAATTKVHTFRSSLTYVVGAASAGKQARTKFSIARHGEKRALQLAKQARRRGEQERLRTPARTDD